MPPVLIVNCVSIRNLVFLVAMYWRFVYCCSFHQCRFDSVKTSDNDFFQCQFQTTEFVTLFQKSNDRDLSKHKVGLFSKFSEVESYDQLEDLVKGLFQ